MWPVMALLWPHAHVFCKKTHPDPRTTRNFRHFRQDFKQDSKVRRLDRHFATPQYWDGRKKVPVANVHMLPRVPLTTDRHDAVEQMHKVLFSFAHNSQLCK